MHSNGLADDEAIGYQFADRLAGVGVGDFRGFVGIEPDLAFATADHTAGETLLCTKIAPVQLKN